VAGFMWRPFPQPAPPASTEPPEPALPEPTPLAAPASAPPGGLAVNGFPLKVTNEAPAPDPGGRIIPITLTAYQVRWWVTERDAITAWTFDGQVPGPLLRVREGDVVEFTLINRDSRMGHSLDFHSARTPWSRDYVDAAPGTALRYYWKAERPGVYMYHCGTAPALMHIAAGMYGAVIVDPKDGWAPAREYVLVQSEMYRNAHDYESMLANRPSWVVFNGAVGRYSKEHPLLARPGELIRLHVVNAGPTNFSAFHVVGAIFDVAYANGSPRNAQYDMQTVTIPPGGSYTVEFTVPGPGDYPIVSHAFADAARGALAILRVAADAPASTELMPRIDARPASTGAAH
ncbi:MAG TPA: multicopper oxidase domain-containing protein, partial [Limnochordia bacterium]